jgi:hypothetical protein
MPLSTGGMICALFSQYTCQPRGLQISTKKAYTGGRGRPSNRYQQTRPAQSSLTPTPVGTPCPKNTHGGYLIFVLRIERSGCPRHRPYCNCLAISPKHVLYPGYTAPQVNFPHKTKTAIPCTRCRPWGCATPSPLRPQQHPRAEWQTAHSIHGRSTTMSEDTSRVPCS